MGNEGTNKILLKKKPKKGQLKDKKILPSFFSLILSLLPFLYFMVIVTFTLLCTAIDYLVRKWTRNAIRDVWVMKDEQGKEENWTGPSR